jgi:predicted Zn-ribbon and HTH transcriptional regulator
MDAARRIRYEDDAPAAEPMRVQRRERAKPSREDLSVRRRLERSQESARVRTAALQCLACGCQGRGAPAGSRCPSCGSLAVQAAWYDKDDDYQRTTNWDHYHPGEDSDAQIHRTLRIYPPNFELWKRAGRKDLSDEEKRQTAHEILGHIKEHPHLGMHWTDSEGHAYRVAHYPNWAGTNTGNHTWSKDQDLPDRDSDLGITAIVHAKWPKKEHLETDEDTLRRYDVKAYNDPEAMAQESEVPVKTGAPVHITGLSWSHYDTPRKGDFVHHTFDEPQHHLAKLATVLQTQIERANGADEQGNGGDMIRTPQGQTVRILKIRPHETENDKVYVDTDMGTSIMSRGTDVELVPHNSQQQELPGSGNPMGNVGQLPGSGRGAGGESMTNKAPTCPVDGAKMVFRNNAWVCPVDGTTAPTGAAPAGMTPTDSPSGHIMDRQRNRAIPQTHLWASHYNTIDRPSLVARSAMRVLSTMEENRS